MVLYVVAEGGFAYVAKNKAKTKKCLFQLIEMNIYIYLFIYMYIYDINGYVCEN